MIALVQRVREASVTVDGACVGAIGPGLLILLGVRREDTEANLTRLARKCAHLRIFPDAEGKMNRSVLDVGGQALVVSQFTLCGDTSRGHRPSYANAAPPEQAEALYERFVEALAGHLGQPVATGVFGAMMQVHLINDGPVTLWLEQ
ncbi:MAG: D-tyrosyl-tRNA(Tyr) deacylase [Bacteroidetes bacterium]|nr:D-tyrosyl-tRNA(Tyr) deacylase [Rhodothermaceae bacterium RA]RMH53599.1 MAG: D-tyrosyl-tRNA(Tyr) deacylase [Bacteroidota bacterium]